jgi:TBC1 domain family member 4
LSEKQIENIDHQNVNVIQGLKDNTNETVDAINNNNKNKNNEEDLTPKAKSMQRADSISDIPRRSRSASIGCIDQNRTMVFILGRCDLRLISTDRKQVLLHKNFADVVTVVQGTLNADHFGIICCESKDGRQEFIGYVFKCQSDSISHDVLGSITKSLETLENDRAEAREKEKIASSFTCDHCPMVWYNKLCLAVEGLNEKKAYNVITKHIEELNSDDYEILMEKFFASDKVNDYSFNERNKFLMALIEAHCQMRQQRHVHDTIENRSEFLNQYLGGSTIFMKAKRSLTSSFDQLLKRRGSRDMVDGNNNFNHDEEQRKARPGLMRSMSLTSGAPQTFTPKAEVNERSQMNTLKMDM